MILRPAGKIFADVTIEQPYGPRPDDRIGIPQIRFALSQRFNLGTKQHHSRFQLLKEVVIVRGGSVLSYQQLIGFPLLFRRFSHSVLS